MVSAQHSHTLAHAELVIVDIISNLSCILLSETPLKRPQWSSTMLTLSFPLLTSADTVFQKKSVGTLCFPDQVLLDQGIFSSKFWHDASMYNLRRNISNNMHTAKRSVSHLHGYGFHGLSISLADSNILNNDGIGTSSHCEWANGERDYLFL